ncbi:proton-coupled amino acid transporter-like protein acs isoform X2 [Choristoneura fumiferana]|uniref:proton-coupled amino acid transporter-like protein acs isoform X2 n=1 Tax=Choristoneura fumiferana TaxID=7141 RepID=UPI003D1572C1
MYADSVILYEGWAKFCTAEYICATRIVASVANLAKGALGGGVLSGHVAYMKSGFVSAIILNFGFGFYLATCFYLLVKSSQILCKRCHVSYMTYPDMAEAALSLCRSQKINRMAICYKHFIEFIICLNLYGSCACYQLIIAKTIKQLVENTDRSDIAGLDGMPSLRVYVAIMIIPVILITLITELKYLAPFSILANAFVGFCVLMAIYYARLNNPNFENMSPFNGLYNQIVYTGMAVFSMSSAGVVLPVENNMENPKRVGLVLFVGYILIIASVFLCSFFGYVGYLENCRSPITINFPMTTFPMILKGCIAAMIYVTHALNFYMPFHTCFVYLKKWHNQDKLFKWELFYRALICLIISIVAIIFPSIDALMGFLGCFCLSNMAFIGPNFIYMVVIWDRPGLGKFKWRLLRSIVFVAIGIFILICGTMVASVEMVETFIQSTDFIESDRDSGIVMLAESASETAAAVVTAAATTAATAATTEPPTIPPFYV